jgi:hypothetical protein
LAERGNVQQRSVLQLDVSLLATKGRSAVSLFPCTICRARRPGKLANAYWAWFLADGSRSAWKVRYCPVCAGIELKQLVYALRNIEPSDNVFACVNCGADASQDSDPIYLTLYVPNREPEEFQLQLDAACAAKMRGPIVEHGERLPDRGGVVRGPTPSDSIWDALQAG